MTREEHKEYNAENYPASVLTWLNDATDRAYDDFESRTCENCKHYKRYEYEIPGAEDFTDFETGCILFKMKFEKTHSCKEWKAK